MATRPTASPPSALQGVRWIIRRAELPDRAPVAAAPTGPLPFAAMDRSLWAVLAGTFTLRFSTGLTGAMLTYYLAELDKHHGVLDQAIGLPPSPVPDAFTFALIAAAFYASELILSPIFGILSDRKGHWQVMQWGPLFGLVAVVITWAVNIPLLLGTRLLEGAATAASIPSILGFIAVATAMDEGRRGKAVARFEAATLAGLLAGFAVAGPLFAVLGSVGFLVNGVLYLVSMSIYRWGVDRNLEASLEAPHATGGGRIDFSRYRQILGRSHVWLLAPVDRGQCRARPLHDPDDLPARQDGRSAVPTSSSWADSARADQHRAGGRWAAVLRRPDLLGEPVQEPSPHDDHPVRARRRCGARRRGGRDQPQRDPSAGLPGRIDGGRFGLFVLAGATPAAIGLLADVTEAYPDDRGAIMGLYSVFLGLGQIGGSLIAGVAATAMGLDGIFVASLVLLLLAVVPLAVPAPARALPRRSGDARVDRLTRRGTGSIDPGGTPTKVRYRMAGRGRAMCDTAGHR